MELKEFAAKAAELKASDIFLKVGAPPMMRLNGKINTLDGDGQPELTRDDLESLAYSIMTHEQIGRFERRHELDLAFTDRRCGEVQGERLPAARLSRPGAARHSPGSLFSRSTWNAARYRRSRPAASGTHTGDRPNRMRQIDYSCRHDRFDKLRAPVQHHHC